MPASWRDSLNMKKTCAEYRVNLWQCPQFLFLMMGMIIILAILVTYFVASAYQDPQIAALIVLALTAVLFSIGHIIVGAFERVALSSKSKSEFISIMSHQLRSPLSAVKWQLDLLLSERSPQQAPQETVQKYLHTVYDQNERMIRSVNDLLEVNRIEDNDLVLRPAVFSIKETTAKLISEYKNFASSNNVEIELRADENLPQVFADEERIRHVIEHLIDNAVKYNPQGGKIFIDIAAENSKIVWKITDTGVGISSKERMRIFTKFFRSERILRYQTEGNGVGLFIAKSIIKKSGGEIGFSSSPNKGSTFWFSLPTGKPQLITNKQ